VAVLADQVPAVVLIDFRRQLITPSVLIRMCESSAMVGGKFAVLDIEES
jgi:hypothetical protein